MMRRTLLAAVTRVRVDAAMSSISSSVSCAIAVGCSAGAPVELWSTPYCHTMHQRAQSAWQAEGWCGVGVGRGRGGVRV